MGFKSGKIIPHSTGLSCCFRQWRTDTHCHFLHGYALQVEFEFERDNSGLDDRMWVFGFGDLKPVRAWMETMFDHKTLVAQDDPDLETFVELDKKGLIQLVMVPHVGVESFAKMIYDHTKNFLANKHPSVMLKEIRVREHESNWACYSE